MKVAEVLLLCLCILGSIPAAAQPELDLPILTPPVEPGMDPCRYCDLPAGGRDGIVGFEDFAALGQAWGAPCGSLTGWFACADPNSDGLISLQDMAFLASCWMTADNEPPVPDPNDWQTRPAPVANTLNLRMVAGPRRDNWAWPVAYQFECIHAGDTGQPGCISPWLHFPEGVTPVYTDAGLQDEVAYTYVVRTAEVRLPGLIEDHYRIDPNTPVVIRPEHIGLIGPDSQPAAAVVGLDTLPPAPLQWQTPPEMVGYDTVRMMAAPANDPHGPVEYRFLRYYNSAGTSVDPAFARDWSTERECSDHDVTPGVQKTYRFQARDRRGNISDLSPPASVTPGFPDYEPPSPNPSAWEVKPRIARAPDYWYYHTMTAERAYDNQTPARQIEYRFECSKPRHSSPWRSDDDPADRVMDPFHPGRVLPANEWVVLADGRFDHRFWTVRVRDRAAVPNETAPSERIDTATQPLPPD